jgi:hypothetical protein
MVNHQKLQFILVCAAFTLLPFLGNTQKKSERFFESGNKSMYVTYKNNLPRSLSMILPTPETDDHAMIVIEGVLETTEQEHHYVFNDKLSGNSWKIHEKGTDFFFECVEGDCFDKNEKFGLWKEPFHFVSEE